VDELSAQPFIQLRGAGTRGRAEVGSAFGMRIPELAFTCDTISTLFILCSMIRACTRGRINCHHERCSSAKKGSKELKFCLVAGDALHVPY
jgi:hypothetical protein